MLGGGLYSPAKLQELIIYVAQGSVGDPHFGETKLNKILFSSDFERFRKTGKSITGALYQHLPKGPAPEQLLPAIRALARTESIEERPENAGEFTRLRVVPLRDADLSLFEGDELATVDDAIKRLWDFTNEQASDESHKTVAWKITRDYQAIPFGTAVLSSSEPNEDDLEWLRGVAGHGAVA